MGGKEKSQPSQDDRREETRFVPFFGTPVEGQTPMAIASALKKGSDNRHTRRGELDLTDVK